MSKSFSWTKFREVAQAVVLAGDHKEIIKVLTRNLRNIRKLRKPAPKGWTCYQIALAYDTCKRLNEASLFYREALRYYRKCDQAWTTFLVWRLGWTLIRRKRFGMAARLYLDEFERHESKIKTNPNEQFDYVNQAGECLWRSRSYEKSVEALHRAARIGTTYDITSLRLARLFYTLSQASKSPEASRYALKLKRMARRINSKLEARKAKFKPIRTKRGSEANVLFGVTIKDPYRWLEKTQSPAVKAWITKQNSRTETYLDSLPARSILIHGAHEFYERSEPLPYRWGKWFYFFDFNNATRTRLLRSAIVNGTRQLVFDSNTLPDGHVVTQWNTSPNGRYLAYTISAAGSESYEIKLRSIQTGTDLPSKLVGLRGVSIMWSRDSKGFYYSFFRSRTRRYQIRYHHVDRSKDTLVHQSKGASDSLTLIAIVQNKYLLISSYKRDVCSILIRPLASKLAFRTILTTRSNHYSYCGEHSGKIYFLTNDSAQNCRVISLKIGPDNWKTPEENEVVPDSDEVCIRTLVCKNILICFYRSNERFLIKRFRNGRLLSTTMLPAHRFIGEVLPYQPYIVIALEGQVALRTLYTFNFKSGKLKRCKFKSNLSGLDDLETTLIWASSKDGTRIPVYVTAKKGIVLDGSHPTLLTAYGGFNIPVRLSYNSSIISWLKADGIVANAVIRGGGEFGRSWHEDGRRAKKQNCFDDFIASAEKLIADGYTQSSKLGIYGFSNGGLLIGSVLAQRPELFGCSAVFTGVLDMLRYHRFKQASGWKTEYGLATNKKDFEALRAYSPLHNLKPAEYPPTLTFTGANDDRVSPAHSYKFAARLQSVQRGTAPILLRTEKNSGHSLHHNSTYWYDMLSFFAYHLGVHAL